jgi:hypothetical protein
MNTTAVANRRLWGQQLKGDKDTEMMRIGFVGAGNIAQALTRGFIAAGKQM